MKKKIIITERQMALIVKTISENNYDRVVKRVMEDLKTNYEPAMGVQEIGNEFYNSAMITKKVTGDTITPKDLLEYLKHKYNGLNKELLKQIIVDWYHGRGDDKLSKNIGSK